MNEREWEVRGYCRVQAWGVQQRTNENKAIRAIDIQGCMRMPPQWAGFGGQKYPAAGQPRCNLKAQVSCQVEGTHTHTHANHNEPKTAKASFLFEGFRATFTWRRVVGLLRKAYPSMEEMRPTRNWMTAKASLRRVRGVTYLVVRCWGRLGQ